MAKWLSPKQWVFSAIARRQFGGEHRPHVIAPSRFAAEHFEQYYGLPRERLSVVYNALDSLAGLPNAASVREQFRRAHGLDRQVALLFVARNYKLKGLEPLLVAFGRLSRDVPARLIICGSNRDSRFRRQAARLGVADRVSFLGFVDDVRAVFAGCDLFAFPTFYDPCSLVVLEAMYAGLPVITTVQNGAGELIREGVDGFVIESPWSVEQLCDRMRRLCLDVELRRRMGDAARTKVQSHTVGAQQNDMLRALARALQYDTARPASRAA
jgi:UDP-glucose:(heptosyl)LPS alpha-1,3-glucosyltransferase